MPTGKTVLIVVLLYFVRQGGTRDTGWTRYDRVA